MPSEILLKIFSYLDAVSLLCAGCVSKRFYDLANDNGIWLKLYSSCFPPKRMIWKINPAETETISLGCATPQGRRPGYWKKEYIFRQIAAVKARVMQLVKPVDPQTGLPCKNREAIRASGLSWVIVLKDTSGKEHVMEQADLSFKDTSVTIFWYSAHWPCLNILSTLELCGVTPLLPNQNRGANTNGPRRRSLIAKYSLSNLTKTSVALGADKLVQFFIMANLKRTVSLPCFLTDVNPEYGLHDYNLHLDMHSGTHTCMCGTFKSLFCRKGDIQNGYLRLTVVSVKDNAKHLPIIGTVGLSWRTDALKGHVKDCYLMDVTVLDETRKPFWCFSAPVNMELSSSTSGLYDYMGHIYTTEYADSEGKVSVDLVWLEETKEYFVINLVLYISTKKVNSWYGTNY
uniref:F-box protein 15 n=1 Tax=Nothoprocta perdicaria TaxID=30464 RepID=A0A8C7EED2_NOTPE